MKTKHLLLFLILFLAPVIRAASPPWYFYQAVLAATIGQDTCIEVSDLDIAKTHYLVRVTACTEAKAQSLANILQDKIGGVVSVIVFSPKGRIVTPTDVDPNQVAEEFETALFSNAYFSTVYDRPSFFSGLTVEFTPSVVQVWSDNFDDMHGSTNYVAQEAFRLVLRDEIGGKKIGLTTAKK